MSLLTDATIRRCKPSVPLDYMVVRKDVRRNGVTCVLQTVIETLVQFIVVPSNATTCTVCNENAK